VNLSWSRLFPVVPLMLAALTVGSCSKSEPVVIACPQGIIPADAAKVTRFRDGPGRDLTDVVFEGEIYDILLQCKRERQTVVVDLQIGLAGTRGPADRTRVADLDFWVAIVDCKSHEPVQRSAARTRFEFKDNRTRLTMVFDEMEPVIPVKNPNDAAGYQVMVGLQLTADELAWNRQQSGK
jgi:hypothetical protein